MAMDQLQVFVERIGAVDDDLAGQISQVPGDRLGDHAGHRQDHDVRVGGGFRG